MTLVLPTRPSRRTNASAVAAVALRVASALAFPIRAWLDRRALAQLASADDRMLADIGVTRSDVMSALSVDDTLASEALAARAAERRAGDRARRIHQSR